MHYLIAAIYFLFSLAGYDGLGTHTVVTRTIAQGVDVLDSEASITPLLARFSCVDSASGSCHYRLFSVHCDNAVHPASGPVCQRESLRELVVAAGQQGELSGLPAGFSFCVDQAALPLHAPCKWEQHSGLAL